MSVAVNFMTLPLMMCKPEPETPPGVLVTPNDPVNNIDPDGRAPQSVMDRRFVTPQLSSGQAAAVEAQHAQIGETAAQGIAAGALLVSPIDEATLVVGALAKGLQSLGNLFKGGKAASGLGDLTRAEVGQIQNVVDEAGRPLDVVGSAARGERRNVGSDLPIGKGAGSRSDTDFTTAGANRGNFEGLEGRLPNTDPRTPILRGTPESGNPSVRFEPNTPPRMIEEN